MKNRPSIGREKYASFFLFLLIASLAVSTFFPPEEANSFFYQAVWFKILWGVVSVYLFKRAFGFLKKKLFAYAAIFAAFLIILLGAGLTTILMQEGFIEIKKGDTVNGFWVDDNLFTRLPFSLTLKDFTVEYYESGKKKMRFVKTYKALIAIKKNENLVKEAVIEVNKPANFEGYYFYQYGYDEKMPNQTVFQVVKEPALGLVYGGYLVLLAGMIFSFKRIFFRV